LSDASRRQNKYLMLYKCFLDSPETAIDALLKCDLLARDLGRPKRDVRLCNQSILCRACLR
jgi:hypothetical protein